MLITFKDFLKITVLLPYICEIKIYYMKEIRAVDGYFLFYDNYMKKYIAKHNERFSLWFEMQSLDLINSLTDEEFKNKCEEILI